MGTDALAGASWECAAVAPGAVATPDGLDAAAPEWLPATVPGTAAGALRAAGRWRWGVEDEDLLDGRDWWFRCRFGHPGASAGTWRLTFDGLATLADAWLNGRHVVRSENMFLAQQIEVDAPAEHNELTLRFAALKPVLAARHPRPRWKSRLVRSQSLRWYRTTLLGRVTAWSRWGAPVGPWRPVRLERDEPLAVLQRRLSARCEGDAGVVAVRAELVRPAEGLREARLRVGDHVGRVEVDDRGNHLAVRGEVRVPDARRWWPHTHGDQPRYRAVLECAEGTLELGTVGFRTVEADRTGDGFALRVNGVPIFCRGACWGAPDPITLTGSPAAVADAIALVRSAGMNMLRVPGYTHYEDDAFWEACDEAGILVWQDCMLASTDPPDDPAWIAGVEREVGQVLGAVAGRPSLAVVCGSSETYQQAAMLGLAPERWWSELLEERLPAVVATEAPGVPYVPSTPSGGDRPFAPDAGVCHYFGVGAYLRPLADARLADVRFAAECLSFATPPEPETVREAFGGPYPAGHDPAWKLTVPRDAGTSWDFEDVRDFYVSELFGVDPRAVRSSDPLRALDLGRAAVAEAMAAVTAEWRRAGSTCAGALVLSWRDLWPGAGWGLLDSAGRPKAPWYALRRVFAPLAVLVIDEGLSGLRAHALNDTGAPFTGRLSITTFAVGGSVAESAEREIEIPAHGEVTFDSERLLGGFRDLSRAYRFQPSAYDSVLVRLHDPAGEVVGEAVHLPSGPARPRLPEVGLRAEGRRVGDGEWSVTVSTRLLAQYVAFDAPGWRPEDSWFHLGPGQTRTVSLLARDPAAVPRGTVRALNATAAVPVSFAPADT